MLCWLEMTTFRLIWLSLPVVLFAVAGYSRGLSSMPLSYFSLFLGAATLVVLWLQFSSWLRWGERGTADNVVRELDPDIMYRIVEFGYHYSTLVLKLEHSSKEGKMVQSTFRCGYFTLNKEVFGVMVPANLNVKRCEGELFIVPEETY